MPSEKELVTVWKANFILSPRSKQLTLETAWTDDARWVGQELTEACIKDYGIPGSSWLKTSDSLEDSALSTRIFSRKNRRHAIRQALWETHLHSDNRNPFTAV